MCGIAAIINNSPNPKVVLESLLRPISHRGEKTHFNENYYSDNISIGMNRLAIVDRDNAVQPIFSKDNRFAIIFNGEIYNYIELADELLSKGYEVDKNSDTSVLLYSYVEWKDQLFEKIDGMFAFIVYDYKNETYFAARDPLGIKPLYYSILNDKTTLFASEIKSFSSIKKVKEIELFPPGTYSNNGDLIKYWQPSTDMNCIDDENEVIKDIKALFDGSVKERVNTDLPIAVYFSGGVDSAAVLATSLKYHNDITAIIVGNENSTDRSIAEKYCDSNGIKKIVFSPPSQRDLFDEVKEAVKVVESFEPNLIRQVVLAKYIAKTAGDAGFKVVLCGEGADELFAGYPELANSSLSELNHKSVKFLKDLHRTQLQRVDRTSMAVTTEVRVPFLNVEFVDYVLSICPELKVKNNTPKYILRQAMSDRLPEYIYNRPKVVLSEGAGYDGNQKNKGLFFKLASEIIGDSELQALQKQYSDWHIADKEEAYYFKFFVDFGYHKGSFAKNRVAANRTDTVK